MLKEKFKDVDVAQKKVKKLRRQLRRVERDFRCVVESSKLVLNDSGAHIVNMPKTKCGDFNSDVLCKKTDCKNYEWAKSYIGLQKRLQDARKYRDDLLVKYFWVCRKYREYKECKKLGNLTKMKQRELLHYIVEDLFIYDPKDDDTMKKQRQEIERAKEIYAAILNQRNVARAKFFGRTK